MYCHQHAYVTWIMEECQPILVEKTQVPYGWEVWTLNDHASPGVSEGGRGKATEYKADDHYYEDTSSYDHHYHHYSSASPEEEAAANNNAEVDSEAEAERPVAPVVTPIQEEAEEPVAVETAAETEKAAEVDEEESEEHGHSPEDEAHADDGHKHNYAISDAKLKKVKDYCKQLCDFGFEPDELCVEFHFTCDNNN